MVRTALTVIVALAIGSAAVAADAVAQQGAKLPRIGVVQVNTAATGGHLFPAFEAGMRERGYVDGQHVVFERRFGEGRMDRLREVAAELVRLKVDVIVTSTDQGIAVVREQTRTIPIVMANSTDPVGTGFVESLARPGGNVTGNSSMSPELSGKRLELLRAIVPKLSRVAILWNPDIRGGVLDFKETETAARSFNLQVQSIEMSRSDDLDRALSALTSGRAQAFIVPAVSPLLFAVRSQIASFAVRNRLPGIYGTRQFAEAGGLMAYGPDAADQWRRAAVYVDKILRGARPGDLPVEQPSRFELIINVKTATAIGITFPPSLLQRADHVIQ
jgi:putative ABC transport system substrate-binding protein